MGDCIVSVEVLQEFFVQSTRLNRPHRIDETVAHDLVLSWSRFAVVDINLKILLHALDLRSRYRFSYWDSAIIAAALSAGCDTLYTEDMQHGQVVIGLRIINRFVEPPAASS